MDLSLLAHRILLLPWTPPICPPEGNPRLFEWARSEPLPKLWRFCGAREDLNLRSLMSSIGSRSKGERLFSGLGWVPASPGTNRLRWASLGSRHSVWEQATAQVFFTIPTPIQFPTRRHMCPPPEDREIAWLLRAAQANLVGGARVAQRDAR